MEEYPAAECICSSLPQRKEFKMTLVSITPVSEYGQELVNEAVSLHCERFSLRERLQKDSRILLKPNLLMKRTPDEFTTTHPAVVEAMIVWLKQNGFHNITLADSPGGPYTSGALRGIYRACGMEDVCRRHDVVLNYDTTWKTISVPNGKLVESFPVITPVCEADFIIDLCKLKTHAMMGLSGAVKNMFGTIPGLTKPGYHSRFPDKAHFASLLIDLCQTVTPGFVLVDAVDSMEGNGPSGGIKKHTGLLLSSDNPYEMDFLLCHLTGIKPERILTVHESVQRGLCQGTMEQLKLTGDLPTVSPFLLPRDASLDFTSFIPGFLKKPAAFFIHRFLALKPRILTSQCIGCGKCMESCPRHTIEIRNKKAVILYKECIRCFCCHEMCPVKAIELRR